MHAVIGVVYQKGRTLYVKRSKQMVNYPGVWSLLSLQYSPEEFQDQLDPDTAQLLMQDMANQRLGGARVKILRYLISGTCLITQ